MASNYSLSPNPGNSRFRLQMLNQSGFPFNDTALVFKVAGKMFALLDLSEEARGISLKCDPELAIELREQHSEVTPAYHFNKIIISF